VAKNGQPAIQADAGNLVVQGTEFQAKGKQLQLGAAVKKVIHLHGFAVTSMQQCCPPLHQN